MPVGETAVLSTIRDVRISLNPRYALPNDSETGTIGAPPAGLTLTATPEPSTFALAAVGGVALAGAAVRRRRTASS